MTIVTQILQAENLYYTRKIKFLQLSQRRAIE
jgi:hypothetical protein